MQKPGSWGRYPVVDQKAGSIHWRSDFLPVDPSGGTILPYGLGRSYGDVCLNDGGSVIVTTALNRMISFDTNSGVLCCEAGMELTDLLDVIVPRGWFVPVTPGTRFVTVGGAIANDVHGKNHHKAGTFGCHVRRFELLRSDQSRTICSPKDNAELFAATIGGMGLTGLITWAEIQLIPITSARMDVLTVKMANLDEFLRLSVDTEKDYDYTVAWIDCLAGGRALGRGHFMCGNHAAGDSAADLAFTAGRGGLLTVPIDMPAFVLNGLTVRLFNSFYYHRQWRDRTHRSMGIEPFFYPLDSIGGWNRIYGKAGLLQYQCVVPHENSSAIEDILETIAASQQGSFLAVLKVLGDIPSPGMLSFPRSGVTLALDFPVRRQRTFDLFRQLDTIVREAGGRLYSAKDACMSPEDFSDYYPQWTEFARHIDPHFSSSFWRRVTGQQGGVNQ
jgi:FAD/FMN-containing dehydrogenase